MEKYVTYYRVSTIKQGQSGLGLDAQKLIVSPYLANGVEIGSFTELESGRKVMKRVQLKHAIDLCKRENATLLIAKLSRLARNSLFINEILNTDLKFIACDNPTATKVVLRIVAAIDEDEADRISERTKDGLNSIKEIIKKQGYYITRAGKRITSLGSPKLKDKEAARQHGNMMRSKVKPKVATEAKQTIQYFYVHRGFSIPKIIETVSDLNIKASRTSIYNYINECKREFKEN